MRIHARSLSFLSMLLLSAFAMSVARGQSPGPAGPRAEALDFVRPSADGSHFVLEKSGARFSPWGVNYDHDAAGRLIEDYWETEWDRVVADLREIKALGANAVRIHLQLGRFMSGPEKSDAKNLSRLRDLLDAAAGEGLYVDVTGLGCYHKADVPPWYDVLGESERWGVQAAFWEAIAAACAGRPEVFCLNLMNEPILPGDKTETDWLAGEFAGKHFVQRIALSLSGRTREQVARAWVDRMAGAIRKHDRKHMITVGVIPWVFVFGGGKPLFYSKEVGENLDFVSVHFYPKRGKIGDAVKALAAYDVGKPLVVEEMFPLECDLEEMVEFIERTRNRVDGYFSFYWGESIEDLALKKDSLPAAVLKLWLERFRAMSSRMKASLPEDMK